MGQVRIAMTFWPWKSVNLSTWKSYEDQLQACFSDRDRCCHRWPGRSGCKGGACLSACSPVKIYEYKFVCTMTMTSYFRKDNQRSFIYVQCTLWIYKIYDFSHRYMLMRWVDDDWELRSCEFFLRMNKTILGEGWMHNLYSTNNHFLTHGHGDVVTVM